MTESPSPTTTPRWLHVDEMRAWLGFLEVSGRLVPRLDAGLKADAGLTFDDYEVLVHLSEAPERRLRMTELSDRLFHSPSRLTQRIDRLVARGFVARAKCEDDRRGTFAVLTDEGFAAIVDAAPGHLAEVRANLIDLIHPDELPVVVQVFERIAAHLRPETSA